MDRLTQQVEEAREQVTPEWDEARALRVLVGIGQLKRRRQVIRAASALACALLLGVGAYGAATRSAAHPVAQRSSGAPKASASAVAGEEHRPLGTVGAGHRLRLADGSMTRLSGRSSELDILENDTDNIVLRLRAGRALFDVVPNAERRFVVSAGEIDVVVVGTVFEVERQDGTVRVSVQRGKVRVVGPEGVRYLETGQSRQFVGVSGEVVEEPPASGMGVPAPELPDSVSRAHRRSPRSQGWRSLSQAGEYDRAYASLRHGAHVGNDPAALMDAADASRLSGHPQAAVKYLERVLREHRASEVAPLAAFTLGRVQLERLGQPRRAASAFASARVLAPNGSLAQDALAREVEALSKAGDVQAARDQAQAYERRYPNGRRLRAVRMFGGL